MELSTPTSVLADNACPKSVVVIGGGRWARVYIDTLISILPLNVNLSVHSIHNSKGMEDWIIGRNYQSRITVTNSLPEDLSCDDSAVIVVNSSHDHESAVEWSLKRNHSVLVEKPLCISSQSARYLSKLAILNKSYLATAHVFLFDSYITFFSNMLKGKNIVSVNVLWSDHKEEMRYGEVKSYEAAVPVYADVLPHILSILNSFMDISIQSDYVVNFSHGGAHLLLECIINKSFCTFELIRNAEFRRRVITVVCSDQNLTLDFSHAPGVICVDGTIIPIHTPHKSNGPLSTMLATFLGDVVSGTRDKRLDISIGVNVVTAFDRIETSYCFNQLDWLTKHMSERGDLTKDLGYLFAELTANTNLNSIELLPDKVERVYSFLEDRLYKLSLKKSGNILNIADKSLKIM